MRASVILSTYNQPRALELVLWGLAVQSCRDFEVVVADDGSGPGTREVIDRVCAATALEVLHVWQEDRGFRKTEALNRGILASRGEYLVFTDGDCIPRSDFVETHLRLAEPERFLSGGYLKLPGDLSAAITAEDVRAGRVADVDWLTRRGWRPGRHSLRLTSSIRLATLLDTLTPTRASWNGHNASGWRADLVRVNGFDLPMAYGGEDRALGERLENAGVRGKQVRFRAPTLHLDHDRPYVDAAAIQLNRAMRDRIRRERLTRAPEGLAEVAPAESTLRRGRRPDRPPVGEPR